ncbi:MAG: glycosyltransferase family 39 protein [Archangiaceae bacterium]|nr:glycosyltransferase family 39 protein [Archangiaceae bacterium]
MLIIAVFVGSGLRGIDFGFHWDEPEWQIRPVKAMVQSGVLLPRQYIYPSLARWVALSPALVTGVKAGLAGRGFREVQAAMVADFDQPDYLFRVRTLFLIISALTIVWIYLAALAIDRAWWKALLAAGAFGLTWEFAYHARWVATDSICTQFSALTLLGLALFHRTQKPGWLYFAAVAAGLCTGTKYPGVVVLATVLLTGALALPVRAVGKQLVRATALGFTAFGAYLVSTPATLLHPFDFYEQLQQINSYYGAGHYTYTVAKGLPHLELALGYFTFDFFSSFRVLSVLAWGAVLTGAIYRLRDDKRLAAVLVSFPAFFLFFFCWKYGVFIVRNFLLVTPFLALLLGRGAAQAFALLDSPLKKKVLAGVVAGAMLAQAVWLIDAGESIRAPDETAQVRSALAWAASHPGQRFRFSDKVKAVAAAHGLQLPANSVDTAPDAIVFFIRAEGPDPRVMPVNDPFLFEAVFGPRETNLNWYSTWEGKDHLIIMSVEKAKPVQVRG